VRTKTGVAPPTLALPFSPVIAVRRRLFYRQCDARLPPKGVAMPARSVTLVVVLAAILSAAAVACMSSPLEPGGTDLNAPAGQAQRPAPNVATISPTSGPVGTTVTITGSGFARERNAAAFGIGYIRDLASSDGSTITFVVPDGLDLCPPDSTAPCAGAHPRTRAGDYAVVVMIGGQKSNSVTFTVTQ
jgi:IPT/TIG domain